MTPKRNSTVLKMWERNLNKKMPHLRRTLLI